MSAHGEGTTRLAQMLYLYRTVNRGTLRQMAREIGTSHATLMRIEHGHAMDVSTWLTVQAWLFARIGPKPRTRGQR